MFEIGSIVTVTSPTLNSLQETAYSLEVSNVPAMVFDTYVRNGETVYIVLFKRFPGCYDMRDFSSHAASISDELCCQYLYGDRLQML